MKAKTIMDWYGDLPDRKKTKARELIMIQTNMARSTFFKVVKGEFKPKPEARQIISNVAEIAIAFDSETYTPNKTNIEVIGQTLTN